MRHFCSLSPLVRLLLAAIVVMVSSASSAPLAPCAFVSSRNAYVDCAFTINETTLDIAGSTIEDSVILLNVSDLCRSAATDVVIGVRWTNCTFHNTSVVVTGSNRCNTTLEPHKLQIVQTDISISESVFLNSTLVVGLFELIAAGDSAATSSLSLTSCVFESKDSSPLLSKANLIVGLHEGLAPTARPRLAKTEQGTLYHFMAESGTSTTVTSFAFVGGVRVQGAGVSILIRNVSVSAMYPEIAYGSAAVGIALANGNVPGTLQSLPIAPFDILDGAVVELSTISMNISAKASYNDVTCVRLNNGVRWRVENHSVFALTNMSCVGSQMYELRGLSTAGKGFTLTVRNGSSVVVENLFAGTALSFQPIAFYAVQFGGDRIQVESHSEVALRSVVAAAMGSQCFGLHWACSDVAVVDFSAVRISNFSIEGVYCQSGLVAVSDAITARVVAHNSLWLLDTIATQGAVRLGTATVIDRDLYRTGKFAIEHHSAEIHRNVVSNTTSLSNYVMYWLFRDRTMFVIRNSSTFSSTDFVNTARTSIGYADGYQWRGPYDAVRFEIVGGSSLNFDSVYWNTASLHGACVVGLEFDTPNSSMVVADRSSISVRRVTADRLKSSIAHTSVICIVFGGSSAFSNNSQLRAIGWAMFPEAVSFGLRTRTVFTTPLPDPTTAANFVQTVTFDNTSLAVLADINITRDAYVTSDFVCRMKANYYGWEPWRVALRGILQRRVDVGSTTDQAATAVGFNMSDANVRMNNSAIEFPARTAQLPGGYVRAAHNASEGRLTAETYCRAEIDCDPRVARVASLVLTSEWLKARNLTWAESHIDALPAFDRNATCVCIPAACAFPDFDNGFLRSSIASGCQLIAEASLTLATRTSTITATGSRPRPTTPSSTLTMPDPSATSSIGQTTSPSTTASVVRAVAVDTAAPTWVALPSTGSVEVRHTAAVVGSRTASPSGADIADPQSAAWTAVSWVQTESPVHQSVIAVAAVLGGLLSPTTATKPTTNARVLLLLQACRNSEDPDLDLADTGGDDINNGWPADFAVVTARWNAGQLASGSSQTVARATGATISTGLLLATVGSALVGVAALWPSFIAARFRDQRIQAENRGSSKRFSNVSRTLLSVGFVLVPVYFLPSMFEVGFFVLAAHAGLAAIAAACMVLSASASLPAVGASVPVLDDGQPQPGESPTRKIPGWRRILQRVRLVTHDSVIDGLRDTQSVVVRGNLAVDVGAASVMAATAGLARANVQVSGSCAWAAGVMVGVSALYLGYLIIVRPFVWRLEQVVTSLQAAVLVALSVVMLIVALSEEGGRAATTTAAVVEVVQVLADVTSLGAPIVLALPPLWHFVRSRASRQDATSHDGNANECGVEIKLLSRAVGDPHGRRTSAAVSADASSTAIGNSGMLSVPVPASRPAVNPLEARL
jgi:hypothetical protein